MKPKRTRRVLVATGNCQVATRTQALISFMNIQIDLVWRAMATLAKSTQVPRERERQKEGEGPTVALAAAATRHRLKASYSQTRL
jgi:hypothetical protein